jgi:hypothetical protein
MPECNVSPAPHLDPPVREQENETMNETENQGKGRIIGMDIHPTVFSACALVSQTRASECRSAL